MVKGVGFRVLSRRGSGVRIPPPALKGYLDTGEYRVGDQKGIGEAGILVKRQNEKEFFFKTLT